MLICPRYYCDHNTAKGVEPKHTVEKGFTPLPKCRRKNIELAFGNSEPDMYCENFKNTKH